MTVVRKQNLNVLGAVAGTETHGGQRESAIDENDENNKTVSTAQGVHGFTGSPVQVHWFRCSGVQELVNQLEWMG